jgi:hypothetical protein
MAEEKKVNPAFVRASDKPVVVEQDLGPIIEPEKETTQFVRASDMPVKIEESLTDEELEDLMQKENEMKQEIEKLTAKSKEEILPEEVVIEDVQEEVELVVEEVREEKKPLKITIKKDPALSQAMSLLAKTKEKEEVLEERGDSMFYPEEDKFLEGQVDLSKLIEDEIEESEKSIKPEIEKPIKKAKVVDISNLTVINKTEIDKERDLRQALFNNKAAFQIVAVQSGYMAKVSPLVHKDIVNMLYGNLGRYEYKKAVYKTVHDKVFDTSVGKLSFDEWLKYTSVEDMETFYYGVYASTFPNEGSFRYTCPECGEEHDYKVNHNNLIKTTDREHMKKLIDEVSAHSTSIEKMKQYSLVGKGEAIQLSDSSLIIELKTPSLLDSLDILRTVPEKTIDKDAVSVTNMLYINKILIPSKEAQGAFTEEINKPAILRIIDNLPIDDANELQVAVFDRVDKNRITYSIKNIKCIQCSHEEKDIPISIEDILFTLIFEKTQ